jgi:uncharacterized protein
LHRPLQRLLTCAARQDTMADDAESANGAAAPKRRQHEKRDGTNNTGPTMATDHIRYDVLARDALRGVLRHVLTDVAEHGLPGEHHFFITFLSTAEGVKLSPRLLAQYPEEMTIILQHQFWDLVVTEDRFEVGLSFGGIPERLVVPFSAIKSFFDPSVQFGLQFEPAEAATEAPVADGRVAERPPAPVPVPSALPAPPAETKAEPAKPGDGAEVVRLDRFRKK